MNLEDLKKTLDPQSLSNDHVIAIWYELHGQWDKAHEIVQDMSTIHAKWLHAYLHRKEGDLGNCKYWYRSAGKDYPGSIDFDEELQTILNDLR